MTARSGGSDLADTVRGAFVDYQHAAEDRRMLGADVGEAVVRLVDAMTTAGYSEQQARNADVCAARRQLPGGADMQSSQPVVVRRQRTRGLADAFVMLLVALVAGWLVVVQAVVKRPMLSLPVAAYVGLVVWLGAHDAQALALYVVIALGVWRIAHKRSFQRLVGGPLRCWWRRLWVYERRWRSTLVLCGLGKGYRLRESVPRIRRVESKPAA